MTNTKCRHAANALLLEHVRARLAAGESKAVTAHIESCPECAREAEILSRFARSVAVHGVVGGESPGPAMSSIPRRALLVAAGLVAVAILATKLGTFVPRDGAEAEMASTIVLDLGGGPIRGHNDETVLLLHRADRWVTVSVVVPPGDGGLEAELRRADGHDPALRERLPSPDPLGRVRWKVPAEPLRRAGPYEIVVRELEAGTGTDGYVYPFRVALVP
jgi:hypothetical protein